MAMQGSSQKSFLFFAKTVNPNPEAMHNGLSWAVKLSGELHQRPEEGSALDAFEVIHAAARPAGVSFFDGSGSGVGKEAPLDLSRAD